MKLLRQQPAKTFIFISAIILTVLVIFGRTNRNNRIMINDMVQYYSYLPATFIYGDLGMYYGHGSAFFDGKVMGPMSKDGDFIQKYTMGMAIMYSPFFFIAHAHAHLSDAPADGYSGPYELWIQLGGVFYVVLGFWFLRKVLRRYFSEWTIAITFFILLFATNMLHYSTVEGAMAHGYIFCLLSIFLYLTVRFHEFPNWRNTILMGLVGGMIVLIRPNHLLIWMIPLLYDLDRGKWGWWKKQWLKVAIWPVMVFLVVLPQLLYWKAIAGTWVYYSYGNEGFFFDDPAIGAMWFSWRKGWLVYSPVMVLGLIGLFAMGGTTRKWRLPVWGFFLATTYVLSAWWCWWYGGSFGQRAMIDTFPLLAIGIASLRHHIYPMKWTNRVFVGFIIFCCLLNMMQSYQYIRGIIHWDSMTRAAYFKGFGRFEKPDGIYDTFEAPDYEAAMAGDR